MASFLVELPDVSGLTLNDGDCKWVVAAESAADARDAVRQLYDGKEVDTVLASATVTSVDEAAVFTGFELFCAIGTAPVTEFSVTTGAIGAQNSVTPVIAGSMTSYQVGDTVTPSGGTSVRKAKYKVTSVNSGAITGLALVDPGDYTVFPTGAQASTSSGSGTGATVDMGAAGAADRYAGFLSALVTKLIANTATNGASLDMSSGQRKVTVASTTNALGDKTLTVRFQKNGKAVASHIGAITSAGLSSAALSFALPSANPAGAPVVYGALKS